MSWSTIVAIGLGSYLLRLLGVMAAGRQHLPPWVIQLLEFMPVALLGGVVAVGAVGLGQELVMDARLVGVGIGAVALAMRAPLLLVLAAGVGATALARVLA
jgi:branched-subunit amino acid transport protein